MSTLGEVTSTLFADLKAGGHLSQEQARRFVDLMTQPEASAMLLERACAVCAPAEASVLRLGGQVRVRMVLLSRRRLRVRLYVLGTKQTRRRTLVTEGGAQALLTGCAHLGWPVELHDAASWPAWAREHRAVTGGSITVHFGVDWSAQPPVHAACRCVPLVAPPPLVGGDEP